MKAERIVTVTYPENEASEAFVQSLPLSDAIEYRERMLAVLRDMLAVPGAWRDDPEQVQQFHGLVEEHALWSEAITEALVDEVQG